MRTKKVLKNTIYSLASYGILAILGLVNRKVFVTFLNLELLGYEGLFANIFSILSLAELGVGTVITYNLYKEIANNDKEEIAKLMMIYKQMYRVIGGCVAIIGVILFFFMPLLIKDNTLDWNYVRIIYIVQLSATICTYFLSYKRILYTASQKEYVCVKVDTAVKALNLFTQIIIIITTKNYILYAFSTVVFNILANLIIAHKYNGDFSYAINAKISYQDFKDRNFFKDIKNFLVHKVSYIVYGGTDNIVISAILGIQSVALYSNYVLVKSQVTNIINKLLTPMQASVGDLIYTEDKEKTKDFFDIFDLLCFFISSTIFIAYSVLFQPFIKIWLGSQFMLPLAFVILFSLNEYLAFNFQAVCIFRNAFGQYENDKKYMILSAIINLVLSIIGAYHFGILGIALGTVVGHLAIQYGRVQFVFRQYFNKKMVPYMLSQLARFILVSAECGIVMLVCTVIPNTWLGFLLKCLICLLIPNIMNILLFRKKKAFKGLLFYVSSIKNIIKIR